MKTRLLIIILLCSLTASASKVTISDSLRNLNEKVITLEKQVDFNNNNLSTTNGSISNHLMISSIVLAFFGLLLIIVGFGISIYINKQVRLIQTIGKTNEDLLSQTRLMLDQTIKVKDDVQNLSNDIHSNISKLYQDLQEEELKNILDELLEKPSRFGDYQIKLKSLPNISQKFLPTLLKINTVMVESYKHEFVKLIRRHFGVDIMLANEDLLKTYTEYSHFSLEDRLKIIDAFADKYKNNSLTTDEIALMETHIIPFAKQQELQPASKVYNKLMEKFGVDYVKKYIKLHLVLDDLKSMFMDFLNVNRRKYFDDNYHQFNNALQEYLSTEKSDVYDGSCFTEDSNWPHKLFNELKANPDYFKQAATE